MFGYKKNLDEEVLLTLRQKRHCTINVMRADIRKRWKDKGLVYDILVDLGFPSTRAVHSSIQRLKPEHPKIASMDSETSTGRELSVA